VSVPVPTVVWVQHSDAELIEGSPEWEYVPELAIAPDEPLVAKHFGDSFEDTTLESVLAARGVGSLVVAHTNLYWHYQEAPGRTAGTVTTAEVDFSR